MRCLRKKVSRTARQSRLAEGFSRHLLKREITGMLAKLGNRYKGLLPIERAGQKKEHRAGESGGLACVEIAS